MTIIKFIIIVCTFCILITTPTSNFRSGIFYKIGADEFIDNNSSSWFSVRSRLQCLSICLSSDSCKGFQYGDLLWGNVTVTSCDLLDYNIDPQTLTPLLGVYVYSFEREEDILSDTTTTTTITAASTTIPSSPCSVDAAFTRHFDIIIFSGAWMHFYNNSLKLLAGPYQSLPISSFLPGWTGTVDAAFTDITVTNLYIISGSEIKTYRLSDKSLQNTELTTQHFNTFSTVPTNIDDVVIFNGQLIIIDADIVRMASNSVLLSHDGPENPFDAGASPTLPPSGVTGVTLTRTSTPLFFVGNNIYHFTPNTPKGLWHYFGLLKC